MILMRLDAVTKVATMALAAVAKRGSLLLAFSIIGGLVFPPVAHELRSVVPVTVLGWTTLIMLRVDEAAVLAHLRRPMPLALVVAVQMLACPIAAWSVVRVLPLDPGIGSAIVILATAPAIVGGPAYARLLGLDPELALVGFLLTTLVLPLVAPPLVWLMVGVDLAMTMSDFMLRLMLVVGLPALLSIGIRRLVGAQKLRAAGPCLDGSIIFLLVIFGFGVMDGIGPKLLAEPVWIVEITVAAALAVIGLNLTSTVALLPFGISIAATAGMMSGFRGLALYFAVLPSDADPRIALFFGLYQIPLYLGPIVAAPVYRSFGKPVLPASTGRFQ
jgi:BASS family bile acid:Na+ symporter